MKLIACLAVVLAVAICSEASPTKLGQLNKLLLNLNARNTQQGQQQGQGGQEVSLEGVAQRLQKLEGAVHFMFGHWLAEETIEMVKKLITVCVVAHHQEQEENNSQAGQGGGSGPDGEDDVVALARAILLNARAVDGQGENPDEDAVESEADRAKKVIRNLCKQVPAEWLGLQGSNEQNSQQQNP